MTPINYTIDYNVRRLAYEVTGMFRGHYVHYTCEKDSIEVVKEWIAEALYKYMRVELRNPA